MAIKHRSQKRRISFNTVKYDELVKIINLTSKIDYTIFNEWFGYQYQLSAEEDKLLKRLINKYTERLSSFLEEELKAKFIIPILDQVDFYTVEFRDWYERKIKGEVNEVEFSGVVDFMLAKGYEEPAAPYFFIQEYKQSKPDRDPKNQLLAEMLVAINAHNHHQARGSYIIGQIWKFVLLVKAPDNTYTYYESRLFDCLQYDDLKQIYVNLQAVKALYCKD